jgi:hypothetical protein
MTETSFCYVDICEPYPVAVDPDARIDNTESEAEESDGGRVEKVSYNIL